MVPEAIFLGIMEVIKLYNDLSPKISGLVGALHQSGQMTPEQRTILQSNISNIPNDPAWAPDPNFAQGKPRE